MLLYSSILLFAVLCCLLYLYLCLSSMVPFLGISIYVNIVVLILLIYIYNFYILKTLGGRGKIFFLLSLIYSILSTATATVFTCYESCFSFILMFQMFVGILVLSIYNYWSVRKTKHK